MRLALKIGLSLVVAMVTLEATSAIVSLLGGHGNPYTTQRRRQIADELDRAIVNTPGRHQDDEQPPLALHPYLGFVSNPDRNLEYLGLPVSPFGFHSDASPLATEESPDDFVIATIGGSMAAQLVINGREAILEALKRCPALARRDVKITSLSMGGFKQPQQLITAAYFLSLGAHFDIVVNLDGVNELVWFFRNARILGVDPSYPYNWTWMTMQANLSPQILREAVTVADMRDARRRLALRLRKLDAQRWATGQLLWRRLVGFNARRQAEAELRLFERTSKPALHRASFVQRGAVYEKYNSFDDALGGGARMWRRGSVLTRDLLAGQGIMYLHLLQPNQYFAGSKPLTDHEKEAFADPGSIYHDPLSAGYSHLLREAVSLEDSGVDFVDLSRIFADHPEELYVDDCCHVNAQGNQILGEAMARLICERLNQQATTDPASPR